VFCRVCGKQLSDDAVFCEKCGSRTSDGNAGSGQMMSSGNNYPGPMAGGGNAYAGPVAYAGNNVAGAADTRCSNLSVVALCISILDVLIAIFAMSAASNSMNTGLVESTMAAGVAVILLVIYFILLITTIIMAIVDFRGRYRKKTLTIASIVINVCSLIMVFAGIS
jgi:hypothetical protein